MIDDRRSRRGDCWDNAVAESFFATLKVELVHEATWATRTAARSELFDYLEVFYNGRRRHSAFGYLSPRAFERRREQEAVATSPRCLRNRGKSRPGPPVIARIPTHQRLR